MNSLKNLYNKLFLWESSGIKDSSLNSVKLNPITLAFQKNLEDSFLSHYHIDSKDKINVALVVGGVFYSLFFFLDYLLVPEYFVNFLIVRFFVTWFAVGFTLFYVNKGKNQRLVQPLISFTSILVVITIIYYIVLAYPKLNNSYYVGIVIIYYWSYSFLKLRFLWATIAGVITFWLFQLTCFFIIDLGYETYIISTSFLLAANFVGMIISYTLEYYARKDFYQNQLLKKSLEANQNLHLKLDEGDQAMEEVQKKLILQSKALECAANSIIMFDRNGDIIWCNNAFTKLSGYSSEELIGKNPRILKSGKHDKLFYSNLWKTILGGRVWSGEIINKKKNGDLYYEEMIITPVSNNDSDTISHFIAIKQDISLRKDMEEELFESEKRLRGLFENATMGIYRTTRDGKILMANNALVKMLGFNNLTELKQRDLTKVGYTDPDQRKRFLNEIYEKGSLIGFVAEWQKNDGTKIYIRESARIDHNEKGEVIFEGTVEDITLSKLAEVRLRESKERLQTVIDNVYDAIFIHDINGKIIDLNSKVLDLYNISRDEALKLNIQDFSNKHLSKDTLTTYWKSVVEQGKTFKFEWKAVRPADNYVFDVEIFMSRIILGEEKLVLANIRDISEQKEANRKLLITQKAVELNTSLIFWITKDAKIIYANNAAAIALDYSFVELQKMKVSDINADWTEDFWEEFGLKLIREEGLSLYETDLIRKNGNTFPVEITTSVINFENEEVIIAIINDITERKIAAENLIKAKEHAEQSDKLKSDFLAGMSHEIRTPVNTILNFVSLIKSDLGEAADDEMKSSFEMIDNGARRLIRTIDSILNMSQLQTGSYELRPRLISIVEEVLSPLVREFKQVALQKNLGFQLVVETNKTQILADQYTLTQLFINLIDNAIKYTKAGEIKIIVCSEGENLLIQIKDTGIGIAEEFLPTLFEPFVQEEMGYTRSFEGNGLGLALVSKYLELNNGSIDVQSKKGSGSTFTVELKLPA
ncbi:MAG: PAS domain S-box protein [Melioribacteraceae bacterium]|nr:PAS domain S-box protein [Melioribacteraceae bacterium]